MPLPVLLFTYLDYGVVVQAPVDLDNPKTPLLGNNRERRTGQCHRAPEPMNKPLNITGTPQSDYGTVHMGMAPDPTDSMNSKFAISTHEHAPNHLNRAPESTNIVPNQQSQVMGHHHNVVVRQVLYCCAWSSMLYIQN